MRYNLIEKYREVTSKEARELILDAQGSRNRLRKLSNLKVGIDLDLNNTKITSLPKGLTVGESLYLYNIKITSFEGLTVGECLYLRGEGLYLKSTQITSLPKRLNVGGKIYGFKENVLQT